MKKKENEVEEAIDELMNPYTKVSENDRQTVYKRKTIAETQMTGFIGILAVYFITFFKVFGWMAKTSYWMLTTKKGLIFLFKSIVALVILLIILIFIGISKPYINTLSLNILGYYKKEYSDKDVFVFAENKNSLAESDPTFMESLLHVNPRALYMECKKGFYGGCKYYDEENVIALTSEEKKFIDKYLQYIKKSERAENYYKHNAAPPPILYKRTEILHVLNKCESNKSNNTICKDVKKSIESYKVELMKDPTFSFATKLAEKNEYGSRYSKFIMYYKYGDSTLRL